MGHFILEIKPKIVNNVFSFAIANPIGKHSTGLRSKFFWGTTVLSIFSLSQSPDILAQVIPDKTLGVDSSKVTAIDPLNQRIEGGAVRGSNLFHSFQEFNVGNGRGVYFGNPTGIDSILSRVTGSNPSRIFGTLGVLGKADLYLLNPNGIIFGPNAALDIQGSFYGSTTNSISLGTQGLFHATQPQQSQLLSVRPDANFLTQAMNHSSSIVNRGSLAAEQNLSLTAGVLDLEGQVLAGHDLTLKAHQLKIRDSETRPFTAAAGRNVLLQGDQLVDIFALNHPDSGLFAGHEMVLRSPNAVQGDAFYFSGGNFTIENAAGELGDLSSPKDPIILSLGDVSFDNYEGSSLHVLAAGSVKIGTAIINAPETGTPGVDVFQETVQLSDNSQLKIDGGQQPTLDVRAGVSAETIVTSDILGFNVGSDNFFDAAGFFSVPSLTPQPTNADIEIGDIYITQPNGLVYLTSQYQPNLSLSGGNITISGAGQFGYGVDVRGGDGRGGNIVFDSRNNINLSNIVLDTRSVESRAGDIQLLSKQETVISTSSLLSFGTNGDAGLIDIKAGESASLVNSYLDSGINFGGFGDSDDISISAHSIDIQNSSFFTSTFGTGISGELSLLADDSIEIDAARLSTSTFGQGDGGFLKIHAGGDLRINNAIVSSSVGPQAVGNSRGVEIRSKSFLLSDSILQASTFGTGNAGPIKISNEGAIIVDQVDFSTYLRSNIETGAVGDSPGVAIDTGTLTVSNGAQVQSLIRGVGNSGKINISARDSISFLGEGNDGFPSGAFASIEPGGQGDSDGIDIKTNSLLIQDRAQLSSTTSGIGDAGPIAIDAPEQVSLLNSIIISEVSDHGGEGRGGDINIKTGQLSLRDGSALLADTENKGDAGHVTVTAKDGILIDGVGRAALFFPDIVSSQISTTVESDAVGQGGGINLSTPELIIKDGGFVSSQTSGVGDAGDIMAQVSGDVELWEGSQFRSETTGDGSGGDISLQVKGDIHFDGFQLADETLQASGIVSRNASPVHANLNQTDRTGGNVTITSNSLALNNLARINTGTEGQGNAGTVLVDVVEDISVKNGSQIRSDTLGLGQGGRVTIRAGENVAFEGLQTVDVNADGFIGGSEIFRSGIFTRSSPPDLTQGIISVDNVMAFQGDRSGGDISISAQSLTLNNGASFNTSTNTPGNAGGIDIEVLDDLNITNDSQFFLTTFGLGNGGDVSILAGGDVVIDRRTDPSRLSGIITALLTPSITAFDQQGNPLFNLDQSQRSGGDISITAQSLSASNGVQLNTSTFGQGSAGRVKIVTRDALNLSDALIVSTAGPLAVGNSGAVAIKAKSLRLDNTSGIVSNTLSSLPIRTPSQTLLKSKAGDVSIDASETIALNNGSGILSSVDAGADGLGGDVNLITSSLILLNGSKIQALLSRNDAGLSGARGLPGNINIDAQDSILISGTGPLGFSSGLFVLSERGAFGPAGDINILTRDFVVRDGGVVAAGVFNDGGIGGDITVTANTFTALNGGQILTNTRGSQKAGSIKLNVTDSVLIDGFDATYEQRLDFVQLEITRQNASEQAQVRDVVINEGPNSGLFANTSPDSQGDGGNITVDPIVTTLQNRGVIAADSRGAGRGGDIRLESGNLFLRNRAEIRANSQGQGDAGSISLDIEDQFASTDSDITTSAAQASGGNIRVSASQIVLNGDSDIRTNVLGGSGGGGDITLTANSILAFDDSDILAFADPSQGIGGNITLNTPAFFGENFFGETATNTALENLDGNGVVNLNATGQTSGIISVPDVSFIQNNLTDLPENLINPETLLANSCIVRTASRQGKFIVTGSGGLPARPGDATRSSFSTGTVQSIPTEATESETPTAWKIGDPIVEPQAAYSLKDGRLVLSRDC